MIGISLFTAISRPRFRSIEGKALPSPRLVSIVVHADVSHLHGRYTLMLMQFGQFLDHDITLTPVNKVRNDETTTAEGDWLTCVTLVSRDSLIPFSTVVRAIPVRPSIQNAGPFQCLRYVRVIEHAWRTFHTSVLVVFVQNDPYFPALNTSSGRPHCIAFTRSLPGQQRLGMRALMMTWTFGMCLKLCALVQYSAYWT